MSYAAGSALQTAIYQALVSSEAVATAVGAAVFDTAPSGPLPDLYVALGTEEVRDASDYAEAGAWHDVTISVVAESASFLAAKQAAEAVSAALVEAPLALSSDQLASLRFVRAAARQTGSGAGRRIDMRFRARLGATL